MKAAILSLLLLPVVSFAGDIPRGAFKSSQFEEAREAAKAQGKALIYMETNTKSTCPKTQWGIKEAFKELKREGILVVKDDADPDHVQVQEMNQAIHETIKIGNSSPRITVVNPEDLKFITGTDYRNMASDKRWSKKVENAIEAAIPLKPAETAAEEAKKPAADSKLPETKTTPKATTGPVREWTNNEGKTIRAAFVTRKDGTVTLKLENGKTVDYPIDKLSEQSKAALPAE